jgi:predicted TIM-barrel fold metal-dependent hydrolase
MAGDAVDVNLVVDAAAVDAARLEGDAIGAAWVTAARSRTEDPGEHDEQLARACEPWPSFHPLPVLVPPTGVAGAYERARRLAATARCRVVRLCPGGHGYPLADWVLSPLPELCQREGVSLVLDFAPVPVGWAETVAFARAYPSLPMVVLEAEVDVDRALPAALDAAPNLVLHVGRLRSPERLVHLAGVYGTSRFVWGSGPRGAAARETIAAAEGLGEDDRAAILRGNAQALQDGSYAERFL